VEEAATGEPKMEVAGAEPVEAASEVAAGADLIVLSPKRDILNKKCYVYIIMKYFIYAAKKPLNREINFPIR
jgi:hypothetical protein